MNSRDDIPRPPRGPRLLALAALLGVIGVAAAGALGAFRHAQRQLDPALVAAAFPPVPAAAPAPPIPPPPLVRYAVVTSRLGRDETVAHALYDLDLETPQVNAILAAMTSIFPFNHAHAGDQLRLELTEGKEPQVHSFVYRQGPADEWVVRQADDGSLWGEKRPVELETATATVAVSIQSSLYESLQAAGEDPGLAVAAADVLAWDVDFYQDVRAGDSMRIVVEKTWADGKFLRYGDVLAAEYDGESVGRKRLFRYVDPRGDISYYDENGQSARRGFLKSPLKYANITSRFGMRFHPVLKYVRAHEGVDYGAPTGTPIWAVGDGTVVKAGWNGGCGRSVTLRHRNGFTTVYCHMSGIAAGVREGARVTQKQVIGYVGMTGLATGPHLHYAVKRDGHYVNPLGLKLPREAPVPAALKQDFQAKIAPLERQLERPVALR